MMQGKTRPYTRIGIGLLIFAGLCLVPSIFLVTLSSFDDGTKPRVYQAYLADLDGDGHLDAFLIYLNELNRVLLNDGQGGLTTASSLYMRSYALALGDINGDGQVNAVITNMDGKETGPMCADAPPGFSILPLGAAGSGKYLAARSLNDGRAADFITGCCEGGTFLWNYETFSNASPCLGQENINAVALADLNGSGRLDAFLAKGRIVNEAGHRQNRSPNEIWLNDGQGNFTDSGQRLGEAESLAVVVGDLNGDGFPDAVVGNQGPDEVWLNDGQGGFSDTGQRLGRGRTHSLFLVDLDGDGSLDLFAAGETRGQVWLNDGSGRFRAGQRIGGLRDKAIALGDLTGDGRVDLFVAGVESYQLWHGAGDGSFRRGTQVSYEEGG
jgi:hypothetical protein